jgi:hypothetical protein
MASVPRVLPPVQPTNAAPLARLFAYTQTLGLERWLARRKRGLSTLVLSLLWLTLAWRGSGRPYHLSWLREPLLVALLGVTRPADRRDLAPQPGLLPRAAPPPRGRGGLPG